MSIRENQRGVNRGQKIMKILQEGDKGKRKLLKKFWMLK